MFNCQESRVAQLMVGRMQMESLVPSKASKYFYKLASESSRSSDDENSEDSVLSIQGKETDLARDTSDLEWDSDATGAMLEYELVSSDEEVAFVDSNSSSGSDDGLIATQIIDITAVSNDGDFMFADSEDSQADLTTDCEPPLEPKPSYRECAQCGQAHLTARLFRYCEKCYKVRKDIFPPRPKRKRPKTKKGTKRRPNQQRCKSGNISQVKALDGDVIVTAPVRLELKNLTLPIPGQAKPPSSLGSLSDHAGSSTDSLSPTDANSNDSLDQQLQLAKSSLLCKSVEGVNERKRKADNLDSVDKNEAKKVKSEEFDKFKEDAKNAAYDNVTVIKNHLSKDGEVTETCIAKPLLSIDTIANNYSFSQPLFSTFDCDQVEYISKTLSYPALTSLSKSDEEEEPKRRHYSDDEHNVRSKKGEISARQEIEKTIQANLLKNPDSDVCVMCLSEPKSGIFVHGRIAHICCCYKCSLKCWSTTKRCPICKCKVSNVLRGFFM